MKKTTYAEQMTFKVSTGKAIVHKQNDKIKYIEIIYDGWMESRIIYLNKISDIDKMINLLERVKDSLSTQPYEYKGDI